MHSELTRNLVEAWEFKAKRQWDILNSYPGFFKSTTLFEANIDLAYYREWFQFWVLQYQLDNDLALV